MKESNITFHASTYGLDTKLDSVISDNEFKDMNIDDFEPNRNWSTIKVSSQEDKSKWIDLMNEYLELSWTPNQDKETRDKNSLRLSEIERELEEIEIK